MAVALGPRRGGSARLPVLAAGAAALVAGALVVLSEMGAPAPPPDRTPVADDAARVWSPYRDAAIPAEPAPAAATAPSQSTVASPAPATAPSRSREQRLPAFVTADSLGVQPGADLPYLAMLDAPGLDDGSGLAGAMSLPRTGAEPPRPAATPGAGALKSGMAGLQPRRSLLQDLYQSMAAPPETAEMTRSWALPPDPAPVASRFVKGRPVNTRSPDLEFDVNSRTSLGVYGGLTHPERGDPLNGTALSRNKDREAGVTLQYRFDSR